MTNSVAKRSAVSQAMLDAAQAGRALMGGTKAMRAAGETYLPRMEAEAVQDYNARLGMSWLFNGYKKTVKDMAGRVFDKPVTVADAPDQVDAWSANIDMQGRDLSEFAREVFKDGLSGPGISWVMVDAPRRGEETTQAEALAQNLRPYFIHLKVEDVLGWKTQAVDNITRLSQIRLWETVIEDDPEDPFAQIEIEQVRVLDRTETGVTVTLYRQDNKKDWTVFEEATPIGVSEIPVVPFYASRTGFFAAEPLLGELADVNIAHWQSQSDQRNILHAARVPILFGAGFAEESGIVVSAKAAMTTPDAQASLGWVEHSGAAIGSGRQDLKDLEFQMQTHGMQLLVDRSDGGATGAVLDAQKETSVLAMTADALKDCLEQGFVFAAEFGGVQFDPDVAVNKDFGTIPMDAQRFTALLTAVNTGQISRRTFLMEAQRHGWLDEAVNIEDELEAIDEETVPDVGE